ncbi:Por secretion system C-terminal sorting domain-containing protein [Dyadobacter soli]|uniref:Por secretion system C-terminal sorting domain-containing protein n=1 Tax=Dyadobacter soli TaxID=659014 RepID=A0A1G7VGA4_9BACT|nr:FG-GAP-like repeat-containing protein [Dyadobacter soli]SDG58856.1 Por secretion system C-terminal sorting domain-containing protein [Dyadobacter soli]
MNLKPLLLLTLALMPSLPLRTDPQAVNHLPERLHLLPVASRKPLARQPEKTTGVEKLKQSDWYAAAMKNMREGEYHFKKVGDSYSTPNRKNNLRFYYDEKGFTVQPRTTQVPVSDYDITTPPDQIEYKTLSDWKVAFNLDKKQVGKGTWQINGSKAEYQTDNITVQYINNMEGMRQNFIVQNPLSDDEDLKLNFSVETTLEQRLSSDRLQFVHEQSGVVLNYEQLKVWDANGKILAANFEKENDSYAIRVNTADAAYPITIDPISTTAAAMVESNQREAHLEAVASAGDVNGDGYSDVIVGAEDYDNGEYEEGVVFIYHGSATGINSIAATIIEGNMEGAMMGSSVATAGDVNGDGYSDVIAGASRYNNGENNEGAVFIHHGSATGVNTTAAAMIESNQANAQLGESVATAGDVNGDGYSDVIVGAHGYGDAEQGAAFIYHGSATGIGTTAVTVLESNQAEAWMGRSVAGAGDVNGDGYSDVVVGAWRYTNGEFEEGAAFVYHGSATGISTTAAVMLECNQIYGRIGQSVASAGDVNGDGYSDVIVGANSYSNGESEEGAAFVYHGSAVGISSTAAVTLESNQTFSKMGNSVASAGDINGDGYSDVIVGANQYSNGEDYEGAAFIYQGSATGIRTTASAMLELNQVNADVGVSVASAGDVNGDGYSDIIVSASNYDNGETDEGAAFVYHGGATGISTTAAAIVESNQVSAQLGVSVASAGDVNGDGYSDVIVGAVYYDNGETDEGVAFIYHGSATGISTTAAAIVESNQAGAQLGISVASAGDVNGDGYSDVIVGAVFYDNGETNEGAAFVYYGSATGISTMAAAMLESNQANAQLGESVASAGDVNGDGYSDVIVGAHFYSNGQEREGAIFIYHGSASGIDNTAAAVIESNQEDARLGYSVAGEADVNGDGYSDVIVGAPYYDMGQNSEGAAFIYHGSATGIITTFAAAVDNNQPGARMGFAVAGAGDVNGDGYSDVIVGAPGYDNGRQLANEGACFIYHGSPAGINTTAVAMIESNKADALMGQSVASAGDVNGDGYSDVIVGAYTYSNGQGTEGAAFIYHGSATGIDMTVTMVESNQSAALMGGSVAGAGDVNGDGYSDVVVGAFQYDNGQTGEGAAFVYYGNEATASGRNNLNLYNVDLATPMSSSNFPLANFGTGLYAKSFLGKAKGKLVWETKVSYEPYSGTPITNSVLYTSLQPIFTDLTITGTELKSLVAKQAGKYTKIRARVQYDPVTAITGQMYGPWRYVPSQTAGTSGGALPVDLISFKVAWQEEGKTARVKFVTENESEICCYEIEKSDNGFHFNVIGHLDARNAAELHTYNFIDLRAVAKKQYYRLKTIHATGETDYSRIVLLQDKAVTEILVFPNPTADLLQLQLNKAYDNVRIQIVSSAGRVVKQLVVNSDANQSIKIPVASLSTGSYFLYLQTGEEKQALQFIKQ